MEKNKTFRKVGTAMVGVAIGVIVSQAISTLITTAAEQKEEKAEIKVVEVAPTPTVDSENVSTVEVVKPPEIPERDPKDIEILAKLIYGEAAESDSTTEQAAIVWCVLNRVDNDTEWGCGGDIEYVVTFPDQFQGYDEDNPVLQKYEMLADDVLKRWYAEKLGYINCGRVLPEDYLWFDGRRGRNVFHNAFKGGDTWDWELESPYKS